MLALASDFARQVLVVDRQVSLLAMLALVVTPVVYVRMHWLALEVPIGHGISVSVLQSTDHGLSIKSRYIGAQGPKHEGLKALTYR